jgi:diguanylate cyclase (GGDEF)-like protein
MSGVRDQGSAGDQPPRREQSLNEVVVAASSLLDPTRLAAVAVTEVKRLLGVDGVSLAFWDAELGVLVPLAFADERVLEPYPVYYPGHGLIGEAFRRNGPVIANDYKLDIEHPPAWSDVVCGAAVPLHAAGVPLGSLSAQNYSTRVFTEADIEVLESVAAQVGPALGTMGTLAVAQLRAAQAFALANLMRRGAEVSGEDRLVELISETAVRLLGADLAGLVLLDRAESGSSWHGVVGARGDLWRRAKYDAEHPAAATIFGGRLEIVRGLDGGVIDADRFPFYASEGVRLGVALPLDPGNSARGSLCLGWRFELTLADEQLQFGQALAGFAGTLVERSAARAELARRASQDELTGLPNEAESVRRIALALAQMPVTVALVDIRNFDQVNEAIGYDYADDLLRALGLRLAAELGDAIVVGRVGGDEFVVVAADDGDPALLGERVRTSMEAFIIDGALADIAVEIRCGVASAAAGGDAQRLLRHAGSALQLARRGEGWLAVWNEQVATRRREQAELTAELRVALAARALDVAYQPILDLRTGAVTSVEALARWTRANGESVSPALFVGLAESLGRVSQITEIVLDRALSDVAARLGIAVSVNVSALEITQHRLPELIVDRLKHYEVDPLALTLELTESASLETTGTGCLDALAAVGVGVAVDDFGRGWSSMEVLKQLPASRLKLDRSYVTQATDDPTNEAIVRASVSLGHALGMEIVAEGVEDAAVMEAVARLGCDHVQGYHVARPMSVDDLANWLEQRSTPRSLPER